MDSARVKAALTPDFHSQAAYVGRVSQTTTCDVVLDSGEVISQEVTILLDWNSIKKVMALISERARIT